ncbi:MAG TPA: bifunctional helix-turn-helix transcriptional regulator/GNAT family N-acetyltransferase [Candidatus Dormibacteraeota bacterium]|nr:bifunctional helix-turn-helix transcriptional regulator/GNAT family N-acetyltransferase [Candidatus Dormibacteraeota bacterium]
MDRAAVQQVRLFNRTVAERIGALTDEFLGRHRPMGNSRTLWEIGPEGAEVRTLRSRLGLDSGYASRVLASLEREGLITITASRDDRRVRVARLTAAGRAERAELDRRADALAWSLLEPLPARQREELLNAAATVERLLRSTLVTIDVESPSTPDARSCIQQYFLELNERFDVGFDPARSISATERELVPPAGLLVVARLGGRPIGCGALKFHGRKPTELKRMWVARDARGLGLGRRLLADLERRAFDAGARTVRLETNRNLKEAIQLYRDSGYREVKPFNDEPYAHHWFEKRLTRKAR